uniref:Uncharacterized protein n=1 Tax=Parascaris equorum TaxID=6256 RepID=A0A914SAA7_PAREQ
MRIRMWLQLLLSKKTLKMRQDFAIVGRSMAPRRRRRRDLLREGEGDVVEDEELRQGGPDQ